MPAQERESSTLKSEEEQVVPVVVKPDPLKVLLEWKSLARPFKQWEKEQLTTIGAIIILVAIILVFVKEWFLIAVIVALGFFFYILATLKPEEAEHKITNKGVMTGGKNYFWDQLVKFWIEEKWGQKVLYIDTFNRFPWRLGLLLGERSEEEIKKILSDYLPEEKPEKTWIDKTKDWFFRQIPLEKTI